MASGLVTRSPLTGASKAAPTPAFHEQQHDEIAAYLKATNTDMSAYNGDRRQIASHLRNMETEMTIVRLASQSGTAGVRDAPGLFDVLCCARTYPASDPTAAGAGADANVSPGSGGAPASPAPTYVWRRRFVVLVQGFVESFDDIGAFMEARAPASPPLNLAGYSVSCGHASDGVAEIFASRPGAPTFALRVPSYDAEVWASGLRLHASGATLMGDLALAVAAAAASGTPAKWERLASDGSSSKEAAGGGAAPAFASFIGSSSGDEMRARRSIVEALAASFGPASPLSRAPASSGGLMRAVAEAIVAAPEGPVRAGVAARAAEAGAVPLLIGQALETDFESDLDGDAGRALALQALEAAVRGPQGLAAALRAGMLFALARAEFLGSCSATHFELVCGAASSVALAATSTFRKATPAWPASGREAAEGGPLHVGAFVRLALRLAHEGERRKTLGVAGVPVAVLGCIAGSGAAAVAAAAFARAGGVDVLLRTSLLLYRAAVRGDEEALAAGADFLGGLRALSQVLFAVDVPNWVRDQGAVSSTSRFGAAVDFFGSSARAYEVGSEESKIRWFEDAVDPGSVRVRAI
jgi:hypothetical protein